MHWVLLAAFVFFASVCGATALTDEERALLYERGKKEIAKKMPPPEALAASARWRFAQDFEKRLLATGINVQAVGDMSYAKQPLTLTLLGPWSRADAYALMTKSDLLSGAHAAGWHRVRIQSSFTHGPNVYFNLKNGVPSCDETKRFCS